jgi:hypothetical protein
MFQDPFIYYDDHNTINVKIGIDIRTKDTDVGYVKIFMGDVREHYGTEYRSPFLITVSYFSTSPMGSLLYL